MKDFIEWLKENNWNFQLKEDSLSLPVEIIKRYKNIPKEYLEFIQTFKECVSEDDTIWFLCEDDYRNLSSDFKWNEFELIGLEAAKEDGDKEWESEIEKWWDGHLPIILSVRDGYAFYAIDMESDAGTIVYGREPEFEETEKVADNLQDFLRLIIRNKIF